MSAPDRHSPRPAPRRADAAPRAAPVGRPPRHRRRRVLPGAALSRRSGSPTHRPGTSSCAASRCRSSLTSCAPGGKWGDGLGQLLSRGLRADAAVERPRRRRRPREPALGRPVADGAPLRPRRRPLLRPLPAHGPGGGAGGAPRGRDPRRTDLRRARQPRRHGGGRQVLARPRRHPGGAVRDPAGPVGPRPRPRPRGARRRPQRRPRLPRDAACGLAPPLAGARGLGAARPCSSSPSRRSTSPSADSCPRAAAP